MLCPICNANTLKDGKPHCGACNKEKFLKLVSHEDTTTMDEVRERIKNRKILNQLHLEKLKELYEKIRHSRII